MITLQNNKLKVSFNEKGAELDSLINLENKKEIIWEGNPDFWGEKSPILFPIVGALKDDQYIYDGVTYNMTRHGFARKEKFEVKSQSANDVVFELKSNERTFSQYPFEFCLEIKYALVENKLSVNYTVKNPSEKTLYFSLGGHPGFAIDTKNGLNYTDYEIVFSDDDKLSTHPLIDNLIHDGHNTIELDNKALHLKHELFYNDALIMTNLKSKKLILRNNKNTGKVVFTYSNFPYFGIWAAKNANFVCMEPWQGTADSVNTNKEFSEKFGTLKLESNKEWKAGWAIEIY